MKNVVRQERKDSFVEIRELKYFVQVAKDGNYSTAAQKLYISQPALSKVIHKPEEEMGFEFFYTFQKRQNLTDFGQAFYEKAVQVISEYDALSETARLERDIYKGQIFLGFPPVAGTCFFCDLIAKFSKAYPGIKLSIEEKGSNKIMSSVEAGTLDVGCVIGPVQGETFDHIPFVQDTTCLAVSENHPLAGRESVVLEELEDEPFVMLGSEFSTHQDIKAACHRAGFEPKVVLLSSQWDFVVQMVRRNFGVAFLPLSLFRRFSFPDIRLLRVENAISVDRLELITKHDCYVSRNVNCFVSFIVQEMEKNPFFGPNTWDQALAQ